MGLWLIGNSEKEYLFIILVLLWLSHERKSTVANQEKLDSLEITLFGD